MGTEVGSAESHCLMTGTALRRVILWQTYHLVESSKRTEIDNGVGCLVSIDPTEGRAAVFFGEHETIVWKELGSACRWCVVQVVVSRPDTIARINHDRC